MPGGDRRFPVLRSQSRLPWTVRSRWPSTVPWTWIEQHRTQIEHNHDQKLERLARRGGLAPEELWTAAHGLTLFQSKVQPLSEEACGEWLIGEMQKLGE